MLDKEQFDKDGKTVEQIMLEAIKGPLAADYRKAIDMIILDEIWQLSTKKDTFTNGGVSKNPGFRPQ